MTDQNGLLVLPREAVEALMLNLGADKSEHAGFVWNELSALLAAAKPVVDAGRVMPYQVPKHHNAGLIDSGADAIARINGLPTGFYRAFVAADAAEEGE